jgi:hypothetical protein
MSHHFPAGWCSMCGLLVPSSEIVDGICSECDDEIKHTPPGPTDAEIDRALDRMDYLFGPGWVDSDE